MKPTVFVLGPSDIEEPTVPSSPEGGAGKITTKLSGMLPLGPFIQADASLKAKSKFFVIGIHKKFPMPPNGRLNLFNLVADADASVRALAAIQQMESKIRPLRYFNRVSDVRKTSRDRLPETLSNIPGCRLPRTKSAQAETFDELAKLCEAFGAWPLIIRARGYHGGKYMKLVENPAELDAIRDESWLYGDIQLIEFMDYRNEQNLYRKIRVIMVDGVPYARHAISSDDWLIHAASRSEIMDHDMNLCRQEARFLDDLRDQGLKKYAGVFNAMQERIGLDIWGIDFALVNEEIIVFEANACMIFLHQEFGKDDRYRYLEPHIRTLKRAVKKMLMTA